MPSFSLIPFAISAGQGVGDVLVRVTLSSCCNKQHLDICGFAQWNVFLEIQSIIQNRQWSWWLSLVTCVPVPLSGSPLPSTATSHQPDSITWSLTYFEGGWEVESSTEVATVSATTSLWSQGSFLPHREAPEPHRSQHAAQTQALWGGSGSLPAGRMVTYEQKGAF